MAQMETDIFAGGLYIVMFLVAVGCFSVGISLIAKGIKQLGKPTAELSNESGWERISAEIIGRKHFDIPQYSGIYDYEGHYEEIIIRYSIYEKEYVKKCADMNFDNSIEILVRRENPNEFRVCIEDEKDLCKEQNSFDGKNMIILIGLGICIGGIIMFWFFLKNFIMIMNWQ